jgi:uncharacterized protein YndB with AHSA1/START domain
MIQSSRSKLLYGIFIPNIVSIVLVGGLKLGSSTLSTDSSSIFIFSSFVIVPTLMGIISAYFWRDLEMKTKQKIGWSTVVASIAILLSALILKEGAICLLIVSPLIIVFILAGLAIGKAMFKKNSGLLKANVFGVLFFVSMIDVLSEHKNLSMVSDTVIVNAPIEKVWPLVVEYEPIKAKEDYWLFQIGMPSPVQSTVDGYKVGAARKCIFSNGYIFDEKIVVYKPNEELTFDIIEQPRDPEIMGHIDIVRGQFILKDNGNGTTTLIGNSWYKLYVFPEWYFGIWSKSITRNVHLRVMEHIKLLSEKSV